MAESSCLIIDKAAYETQDLVLKAMCRFVINCVDISPSPFPTGLDGSDGYQTTGNTVFMGIVRHQTVTSSFIVHLELMELNREGHLVGRTIYLTLDRQSSIQWLNNSILRSSLSNQVYKLLILFQNIPFQCDSEKGNIVFNLNMMTNTSSAAKIWVKHFFPTAEENRKSITSNSHSNITLEEAIKSSQAVTIYGVISAIPKAPMETNNTNKMSFNGCCKIVDPSCFDPNYGSKSFNLRIFSETLDGYPVINEGDIIRCSNIRVWPSQIFCAQNEFKAWSAETQIVVFPRDDTKEPYCVAESFKFSLEDYEQVCKLRQWYRELNPNAYVPSAVCIIPYENPGAASLSKIPESRSRQSVNEESGVEMAQDIPSLTATEEHYEGRGTSFFSPNVFSETVSLLLPVQLDKSQPRKIDDHLPSSGESSTDMAMRSIPSTLFSKTARTFNLINEHLLGVGRLLDEEGPLDPSESMNIRQTLEHLLKMLGNASSKKAENNSGPSSSQVELDNCTISQSVQQDRDDITIFESEEMFHDDPYSPCESLDFPDTNSEMDFPPPCELNQSQSVGNELPVRVLEEVIETATSPTNQPSPIEDQQAEDPDAPIELKSLSDISMVKPGQRFLVSSHIAGIYPLSSSAQSSASIIDSLLGASCSECGFIWQYKNFHQSTSDKIYHFNPASLNNEDDEGKGIQVCNYLFGEKAEHDAMLQLFIDQGEFNIEDYEYDNNLFLDRSYFFVCPNCKKVKSHSLCVLTPSFFLRVHLTSPTQSEDLHVFVTGVHAEYFLGTVADHVLRSSSVRERAEKRLFQLLSYDQPIKFLLRKSLLHPNEIYMENTFLIYGSKFVPSWL